MPDISDEQLGRLTMDMDLRLGQPHRRLNRADAYELGLLLRELIAFRAAPVGGQAEPSDARAKTLHEAADEVRTEARWQESLRVRGVAVQSWQESLHRLLMVEQILRSRAAAAVSGEQASDNEEIR